MPEVQTLKFDKLTWLFCVLTLQPTNYLIGIFTHLKLCLADAIHNFKWPKIIQIWQMEVNYLEILLLDVTFYI